MSTFLLITCTGIVDWYRQLTTTTTTVIVCKAIPGNSRESATPKIPGGNSRELLSSRWEFLGIYKIFPILVIFCCELWNLADMKTDFAPLFEFKSLNRAQQTKLLYREQSTIHTWTILIFVKLTINWGPVTSLAASWLRQSLHLAVVAVFLGWKTQALAILLICDFMDSSESNITPRLRTVWAQWLDEEVTE